MEKFKIHLKLEANSANLNQLEKKEASNEVSVANDSDVTSQSASWTQATPSNMKSAGNYSNCFVSEYAAEKLLLQQQHQENESNLPYFAPKDFSINQGSSPQ